MDYWITTWEKLDYYLKSYFLVKGLLLPGEVLDYSLITAWRKGWNTTLERAGLLIEKVRRTIWEGQDFYQNRDGLLSR